MAKRKKTNSKGEKRRSAQMELSFGKRPVRSARSVAASSRKKVSRTKAKSSDRSGARSPATAESMAKEQRNISVSEFFAKNRHLLGFDNKRKALLMTVKEAVDNSLDACEEADILPEIHVQLIQVDEDRFRVIIQDNGPGIVKQQIPNIFGKLLYGSKFHRLKMSRGQQGIGISAAGMYGMLTTGKAVKIISRTSPKKAAHHFEIQIDTRKNEPHIVKDKEVEVDWARGTRVEIALVGAYSRGKQSVDEYLEQTAIANPHTSITYHPPGGEPVAYPRGSDVLPEQTEAIKPHPYGIELGVLIKMLHETKSRWLSGFLTSEFACVGPKVAEAICRRAKLEPRARPKRIARQAAEALYKSIQETKLRAPSTNCLAPIGAQQILAGLLKEVKAEFFTAATRPPAVYRGNPFEIEVGLAYGGALGPNSGDNGNGEDGNGKRGGFSSARVIRFANRVPLLYQQSACCIFKSIIDTDWRRYGCSQPGGALPQAPLVIMVHMASVWVPFTSESKEAIADYDEIRKEIKLALQECGRKLNTYLNRRKRVRREGERRSIFERYIKEVALACASIDAKVRPNRLAADLQRVAERITAQADEILGEDGKPIRRAKAGDEGLGEHTVVIDRSENRPEPVPQSLFDDNVPAKSVTDGRRRKRARSA